MAANDWREPPREITYRRDGDYLIPDIGLTEEEQELPSLTKYGMMHKSYLKESRELVYTDLLLSGELFPHCLERERQAEERLKTIMGRLLERNPISEETKQTDPLGWAAHMNGLKARAEESVLAELIYAYP